MLAEPTRCQALRVTGLDAGDRGDRGEKRLLVVFQSRSGGTMRLVDSATEGARMALDGGSTVLEVLHAFDTEPEHLKDASAVLLATPANFGYMSGAMKDFFERVYHPCIALTVGMPYTMIIKGDTDVDGAAQSIERIATGMRWRLVLPPVLVVGESTPENLESAYELGATLAAGVDSGIY
jgi:hypothetical protein